MGIAAVGIASLLGTAGAAPARAHEHDGYSHQKQGVPLGSWMADLDGSSRLSTLSIPGTHDSMSTGPGGDIAQTQSLPLTSQLEAGIRFLDIRVAKWPDSDTLYIHHGPFYLGSTLDGVLADTASFLRAHPTEAVLLRLKQEHTTADDTDLTRAVRGYVNAFRESIWSGGAVDSNPTLDQIRGRIVILQNFLGGSFGISYPDSFSVLDDYTLTTNWDLYGKWEGVRDRLLANDTFDPSNRSRASITYLSGSGGSFPYFVASGHSSPQTGAPRLSTGLVTPFFSGSYPDFPRVACAIGMCSIAFEGTNVLTTDLIRDRLLQSVGIVVADFPGPGLISAVIDANWPRKVPPEWHRPLR